MYEIADMNKVKLTIGKQNAKKFKGIEIKGEKTCTVCIKSKPLDGYNIGNCLDGKDSQCKECKRLSRKNSYAKSVGKSIDQIIPRSGKIVNSKKLCSRCRQWKHIDNFRKGYSTQGLQCSCNKCGKQYQKISYTIIKMEFVLAYGGCCQCCGETRLSLLTIEHIKNKGHKLIYDVTYQLMYRLKVLRWPEGYTCLCYNCNLSSKNNTPCCHTKEYEIYEQGLELSLSNYDSSDRQKKYYELKHRLMKDS